MADVTFGLRLPVAGPFAGVDSISRAAAEAIENGWNTLWVHDFIVWTRYLDLNHVSCGSREVVEAADGPPVFHESLTNLAFLAGLTRGTDVKLGVAVLCMPYRNPIVAARQIANIDVLSDGRLVLGVGVGAPKNRNNRDFEVLGVSRMDKYKKTREYVGVMQEIWKDGVSEFKGEYIEFEPSEFYPKPVQKPHPPIWLGGAGDKTKSMVLDFGGGWLPGVVSPDGYAELIGDLKTLADETDREVPDLTYGLEITTCVATERETADARAEKTLTSRTRGYPMTLEEVKDFALVGSVDDVRDRCIAYVRNGVQHFEIKPVYQDLDQLTEQIELFGKEIIPAVQEAAQQTT